MPGYADKVNKSVEARAAQARGLEEKAKLARKQEEERAKDLAEKEATARKAGKEVVDLLMGHGVATMTLYETKESHSARPRPPRQKAVGEGWHIYTAGRVRSGISTEGVTFTFKKLSDRPYVAPPDLTGKWPQPIDGIYDPKFHDPNQALIEIDKEEFITGIGTLIEGDGPNFVK